MKIMKHFRQNERRLFLRFIFSNLLVLILAFTVGLIGYRIASNIVEQDIKRNNHSMLEQSKNIMDQKLYNIRLATLQISSNSSVQRFSDESVQDGTFSYVSMLSLMNELGSYRLNLDPGFICDYFIYFKNSDYIVKPETSYAADFYYNDEANKINVGYDEWNNKILNGVHNNDFYKETVMYFNYEKKNVVLYLQSIPYAYNATPNGTLAVIINKAGIDSLFSGFNLSQGGWIYIQDSKGNIITTLSKNPKSVKYLDKNVKATGGFLKETIDGKKMTVNYTVSSDNGWRYVLVMPEKVVMDDLNNFQRVVLLIFILTLIFGVMIAFYMAYYNSKPVLEIVRNLRESTGTYVERDRENAFDTINQSISSLVVNNRTLEEKVSSLALSAFTDGLIKGKYNTEDEINANLHLIGLNSCKMYYTVMVVKVFGRNLIDGVSEKIVSEINTVKVLLIESIRSEFMGKILIQDIDLQHIAVIICFENTVPTNEEMTNLLEGIFSKSVTDYNSKLLIGIGDIYDGMLDIWRSYQEAMETLNYIQLHRGGKIKWFREIPIDEQGFFYPVDYEQRLINYVKAGDISALKNIYDIIMNENFEKRSLSTTTVKSFYYDMKSTLMKLTQQVPNNSEFQESVRALEFNMVNDENFDKLFERLNDMCRAANERKNDKYQSLICKVVEFIQESFANPNLSLSLVASEFNISEGYLSYLFKEQKGQNFADFVEQVRLDEACSLLRNSHLNINEIYVKCGYNNVQSFRRAFKRIKGVNPMLMRNGVV